MFERFTDRARKVWVLANQEARRFNHEHIGSEHILLGLVKEGSGVGQHSLKRLGVGLRKVRLEVEKLVKSGARPRSGMVTMGQLPQTPHAKKVIEYAIEEARSLNHNYIGTEHLLLGLCRETDGVSAQIFANLEVPIEKIRSDVMCLLETGENQSETLQKPAVLSPFSLRFVDNESRCELLDADGQLVDSKIFSGPIGVYMYNALRKHEASQKILRDLKQGQHIDPAQIDNLLD